MGKPRLYNKNLRASGDTRFGVSDEQLVVEILKEEPRRCSAERGEVLVYK